MSQNQQGLSPVSTPTTSPENSLNPSDQKKKELTVLSEPDLSQTQEETGKKTPSSMTDKLQSMALSTHVFRKQTLTVFSIKPKDFDKLSLLAHDADSLPLHTFAQLKNHVENDLDAPIVFSMNAGMFEKDFSPVGLWVQNGIQLMQINRKEDLNGGNFYLKENGVFAITKDKQVFITPRDQVKDTDITKFLWSTQSGPMLVVNSKPRVYKSNSGKTNKLIRNAVATCMVGKEKSIVFAISQQPITFPDISEFFTAYLNCDQALYLDGTVSKAMFDDLIPDDTHKFAGFFVATEKALRLDPPSL